MKVFVLGAGVIGVATAHYSAEDGHDAPLAVRWAQGWSMPCGSGRIVAHLAADRAADIALEGLTLERYA
jgi:glycine/D-amino acid oxidase-like deaminating enzyme